VLHRSDDRRGDGIALQRPLRGRSSWSRCWWHRPWPACSSSRVPLANEVAVFYHVCPADECLGQRKRKAGHCGRYASLPTGMPLLSRYLQRRRLSKIRGYVRGAVLDLGCGDASLMSWLAPDQPYTGVDSDAELVAGLQSLHPSRRFIIADLDADAPDLEPGAYDTVVMSAVVEHLRDPARLLASLPRWLAPNGRLVITTPTRAGEVVHRLGGIVGLFSRRAVREHQRIYSRRSLVSLIESFGFVVEYHRTFELGLNRVCVATREARRKDTSLR
jgi:SAM-dependent methyltransferase